MSNIILCADDSKTMQTVAEITFRVSDYTYVGAMSADEALEKAREDKPALILADAIMPGQTGYDLCKQIKADPQLADVPVFLMCGNSAAYDAAKGTEAGADGHVTKPWDSQVMLDKVAELLEKFSAGAAARPAAAAAAPAAKAPVTPVAAPKVAMPPTTLKPPAKTPMPPLKAPKVAMPPTTLKPPAKKPSPPSLTPSAPARPPASPAVTPKPPILPTTPAAVSSKAATATAARTHTIMGMPTVMPPKTPAPPDKPASESPLGRAPTPEPAVEARAPAIPAPPGMKPAVQAPAVPPAKPAVAPRVPKRPATAPPKYAAPSKKAAVTQPGVPEPPKPAVKPEPPAVSPPAAAQAVAAASVSPSKRRPPMIKGTPTKRPEFVPPSQLDMRLSAATGAAVASAAQRAGLDPGGPEYKALLALSKDVVERVVWEVVPELAEAIIRENLDRLTSS